MSPETRASETVDSAALAAFVEGVWDDDILPRITEYIRIPNKSPDFDPDWAEHGYMDQAVELIEGWCRAQEIEGLTVEVVRLEGRTPLIYMEVPGEPGTEGDTVLLYGHLDKQPEMVGWREGLGPWEPVREGDRLYGRGGADDGYAAFASLTAIRALREHGGRHARCVVIIEACEESGSFDLPHYIDALSGRIGQVSLVVCLDSGCGNYEQLWSTTSLRGMVNGVLTVEVLREGVHSGDAGGIVPSCFSVVRKLLDRLEDPATGRVIPESFHVEIEESRVRQAARAAEVLGEAVHRRFPFVEGAHAREREPVEYVLDRTWRPALAVTGESGIPDVGSAGNVVLPKIALKLSLRLPPTLEPKRAADELKQLLESDPPFGARVSYRADQPNPGWAAPPLAPWLEAAVDRASEAAFGKPAVYMGEGGSIPFMGMLGEKFPDAQFLITGVLGPESNAHGPNEFLHVPMAKRLTACVSHVLAEHLAHVSADR